MRTLPFKELQAHAATRRADQEAPGGAHLQGEGGASPWFAQPVESEEQTAARDIVSWFARNAPGLQKGECVREEALDEICARWNIPQSLVYLLDVAPHIYYRQSKALSPDEVLETVTKCVENCSAEVWSCNYVPFAADVDGNLLVLLVNSDLDSDDGVFDWDPDSGLGPRHSASFSEFLLTYRRQLSAPSVNTVGGCATASGLEFIEEIGVVECMVSMDT
mmetsp:Transcript_28816/g.66585  ORF Transcript_28816/g.66585 Transcript_28816/m.66585 type:complete len:220 (+) Transcript_28816:38-697(+)